LTNINEIIKEMIRKEMDLREASKKTSAKSPAAIKAAKSGLEGGAFGMWKDKTGKVVAKSVDGGSKLVAVKGKEKDKESSKSKAKDKVKPKTKPETKLKTKEKTPVEKPKSKGLIRRSPPTKTTEKTKDTDKKNEEMSGKKTAQIDTDVVKNARIAIEQASRAAGREITNNAKRRISHIESVLSLTKNIDAKSINISQDSTIINALGSNATVPIVIGISKAEGLSPSDSRLSSGKKFAKEIEKKFGKEAIVGPKNRNGELSDRFGKEVEVSIDGLKYKYQFVEQKESVEGSDSGETEGRYSQAHEGIVSIAGALLMSGKPIDEVISSFDNLIKNGSMDLGDSFKIGIGGITEEGQKWLRSPNNIPEAVNKLKELLESKSFKSTLAKTEAAIVALHGKDWRKTHSFHIICEGGEDTDTYRADVIGYLVSKNNPEDRKTVLGMSVKDGKSSQMGQIGPLKAAKEIANGNFDGSELKKVLDKFNPKMQESLRKKIIDGYKKKENFIDNFNIVLMDSFLEGDSPEEKAEGLYEYIRWSMVGTNPPDDEVFVLVDDTNASVVPKKKASEAIELKKMFAEAFKRNLFKLENSESGLSYVLSIGGKGLTQTRKKRNANKEVQRIMTDKLPALIRMFHDDDPAGALKKIMEEILKNESVVDLRKFLKTILHGENNIVYR